MKLHTALSGVVLMRAMLMLHLLTGKYLVLLKMHLRGLARVILSQQHFHFSYLSDHTERGDCMGKSLDV